MEISPEELAQQLKSDKPPHLLDVRQPEEFALVALENAQLIPLADLATRANEIPEGVELVVYCHHGLRSQRAVGLLATLGREARSLRGGIELWARQIDPSLPRY